MSSGSVGAWKTSPLKEKLKWTTMEEMKRSSKKLAPPSEALHILAYSMSGLMATAMSPVILLPNDMSGKLNIFTKPLINTQSAFTSIG